MKFSKHYLKLLTLALASAIVVSQTTAPIPATEQTTILWSLAPCQSAFWIPSTSSEFNQNWITYQYEGNPVSQFGECIFTLESDPNTRIEMIIQEVHLFGNGLTVPPPCLQLYDVKADGSIVLLKKECSVVLSSNLLESVSTFTETNLAVISTTIRYGNFQLRARAVPKTFGFPPKVSSTTLPTFPATETVPTVTVSPSSSTSLTSTATEKLPSVSSSSPLLPTSTFSTLSELVSQSTSPSTASTRSNGLPRVYVKMVPELYKIQ